MDHEVEVLIEKVCQKLQCSQIAVDLEKLNHARDMLTQLQQREAFERIIDTQNSTSDSIGADDKDVLETDPMGRFSSIDGKQNVLKAPPAFKASRVVENIPKAPIDMPCADESPKELCSCETTDETTEYTEDMMDLMSGLCEYEDEEEQEPVMKDRMSRYFYTGQPCYNEIFSDPPEDAWHGHFKGFQILREEEDIDMSENKKCIEMMIHDNKETLALYMRTGVRCFAIDLFTGTERENQALIVRMRECELSVSEEFGFPIRLTLFAKLSPRLQYTGLLNPPHSCVNLKKGDEFMLTSDRYWSSRCSRKRVYVNARFLLGDIKPYDVIFIGPDIQIHVKEIDEDRMRVHVDQAGVLRSRMPVVFPSKCNYSRISVEELEDITFAKEVGINVLVTYIPGTQKYLKNLRACLVLLKCEQMRLCARIVLNEIEDNENDPEEKDLAAINTAINTAINAMPTINAAFNTMPTINAVVKAVNTVHGLNTVAAKADEGEAMWIADAYDGFIIEINLPQDQHQVELFEITKAAEQFLERVYQLQKPIIFDPAPIAEHKIIVDPPHYLHVFLYPDKYLYRGTLAVESSFYFSHLQGSMFTMLPEQELSKLPYCDGSITGSDTIARSCVAAAYEMNAAVILVCSYSGRMAIKISHFRPRVPIVLITSMQSASHFISMYHNIFMLYFPTRSKSHRKTVYQHLLFGLVYAQVRKLLRHQDQVLLVYSQRRNTQFNDKYVSYKFDEYRYAEHLNKIIRHE